MASPSYLSGTGQAIAQGGQLVSQNGLYQLNMQNDGNLVVYYWPKGVGVGTSTVYWSPETFGTPARMLYFNNGWVCVGWGACQSNQIAWVVDANPNNSIPACCLSMDNDGCLRIYPSATPPAWGNGSTGTALWSTNSYLTGTGQAIAEGGQLVSANGLFQLNMQKDGNLVVYYWPQGVGVGASIVCWSPQTGGSQGPRTLFFNNGWIAVAWGNCYDNQIDWVVNANPNNSIPQCCLSMDNDGSLRIYPSATPPALNTSSNPTTTALWQSPNYVFVNLMNCSGPIAAWPTLTAAQQLVYNNNGNPTASGAPANLVNLFNQQFAGEPQVTDLRQSVYSKPATYIDFWDKVSTIISQNNWNSDLNQILTEVNYLGTLSAFASSFSSNVGFANQATSGGATNAQNYLNQQKGQIQAAALAAQAKQQEMWALLTTLVGVAGKYPPLSAPCGVVNALIGIYQRLKTSGGAPGDAFSGAIANIVSDINQANSLAAGQASNVYAEGSTLPDPICSDWGKLSAFNYLYNNAILPQAATESEFNTLMNDVEINIYQMLLPSFTAIVNYKPVSGASHLFFCSTPPIGGGPDPTTLNLDDDNGQGAVWDRLTNGLGVSQSTILNREGGWSSLPIYTCQQKRVVTDPGKGGGEKGYTYLYSQG